MSTMQEKHSGTTPQCDNSFWFFGCSFTAGYPLCNEWASHDFKSFYDGKYENSIYPKLLAKHFDLTYRNYATPGASNQTTLVKLSNCLQLMKPGDKVWVNSTWPGRLPVPSEPKNGVVDVLMMTTGDETLSLKDWGDDGNDLITAYLSEIILPNDKIVYHHWRTALFDLTTHLNNIGIKAYLWDAMDKGHNYELIRDWDKESDDAHLSPNGHQKLFEDSLEFFM